MPEEKFLTVHLHELFSTLRQRGVLTISTVAQQGFIGSMTTPIDVSYLADALLLFRYYEAFGEVRRAISVVKKRSGPHQSAIRDFSMSGGGFHIGEPLYTFRGVMTGVPIYLESSDKTAAAE
jgi:circadian clock protein KaiC